MTVQTTATHRALRSVLAIGYFGSWLIAAALLAFGLTALLWRTLGRSFVAGIDDDLMLLALPVGALVGIWAAIRNRNSHALHRVLAGCGALIAAFGILMAVRFVQGSNYATGSGPLAGLGELAAAGMSIAVAACGVSLCGIWAFAKLTKSVVRS